MTEELKGLERLLDEIPAAKKGMERAAVVEEAKQAVAGANATKRSFKMEIRLVADAAQRRKYESRLSQLDARLKGYHADVKAAASELARGELFVSESGGGVEQHAADGVQAGDTMLKEAHGLQDKTQDSLARTKAMVAESKEVGVATLEELQRQREVLTNIDAEADRIDDNLARAEKLLKQFGRRMASDHFIQCFTLINVLLLLGVILYAILKGKTLRGQENVPFDPASTEAFAASEAAAANDDNNRFFLRG